MLKTLLALLSGVIFGLGLIVAGMANPAKVLAFLDVTGAWDPSLALVMAGAIVVAAPAFLWAKRRERSLLGETLQIPAAGRLDRRLLAGSALFGIGWGIAGICPPDLDFAGFGVVVGEGGDADELEVVRFGVFGRGLGW